MSTLPHTPTDTPLLQVQHLGVRLHTHAGDVDGVREVSFTLQKGETLGVVGESGSGKSLTALALMGLLPSNAQTRGSVRLSGHEVLQNSEQAWCELRGDQIGMVFQEPMTALNPVHRIGDQVMEPMFIHRKLSRQAAKTEALALLARVGIADPDKRFDQYPHQFSGGQRQRITIAMALACNPEILIADEPTTALDVTLAGKILELIQSLVAERGMGLLLISHDLGVIARHVQRVMVMYGGTVVESGPTREVFSRPAHPYTRGLIASRPGFGPGFGGNSHSPHGPGQRPRLPTIPGQVPPLHLMPPGCPFADRCAIATPECNAALPAPVTVQPGHVARCIHIDSARSDAA